MYRALVRTIVRRTYADVTAATYDRVVDGFASDALLVMLGEHPFAGERRGREVIRAWFRDVFALFPDFRLAAAEVIASGPPWNATVATRFRVSGTFPDGAPYRNEGMQFLRLRWGRVLEDRLYEDTQHLVAQLAAHA